MEMHCDMLGKMLVQLPHQYQALDPNRMTLLHFILAALDILQTPTPHTDHIVDWVYALQVHPDSYGHCARCGFAAAPNNGTPFDPHHLVLDSGDFVYAEAHIAMTYSALCVLRILGDDLGRVNRGAVVGALRHLHIHNGSFRCLARSSEDDMRFVYCACAISELLNDWSGVDKEKATEFILSCQVMRWVGRLIC